MVILFALLATAAQAAPASLSEVNRIEKPKVCTELMMADHNKRGIFVDDPTISVVGAWASSDKQNIVKGIGSIDSSVGIVFGANNQIYKIRKDNEKNLAIDYPCSPAGDGQMLNSGFTPQFEESINGLTFKIKGFHRGGGLFLSRNGERPIRLLHVVGIIGAFKIYPALHSPIWFAEVITKQADGSVFWYKIKWLNKTSAKP